MGLCSFFHGTSRLFHRKEGSFDSAIDDTLLNTKRPQFSELKVPVQNREFVEGSGTRV